MLSRLPWRVGALVALLLLTAAPSRAQLDPRPSPGSAEIHRDDDGRPWLVGGLRLATQGTDPASRALDGLRQLRMLDLDLRELVPLRTRTVHGLTIVRFARLLRLEDAALIVRDASVIAVLEGTTLRFVVDHSGPAQLATDEPVAPDDALAIEAAFGTDSAGVRILEQHEVALALHGELHRVREVELGRELHERFRVYLGTDGVIAAHSRIQHALGRVYEPNPPVAMEMTSDVELLHLTSARFLTGRYVRASSCDPARGSCAPIQRAEADMNGDFLYDPDEPSFDDEFAEVNVYHHTDSIAKYFRDTHGLEWNCCETSSIIDVIANYFETMGAGYDNAFFSPPQCSRGVCATMAFGQGASRDFGYDGDVVYHEYGHGIVDVTAGFSIFLTDRFRGVYYDPGALNEATADYFAATFADDPKLADYFAGASSIGGAEGALRELDGDLRCPDDLFGEIHQDGVIWGQAMWSIREAIGQDKADQLVFTALVATPSSADFPEAAEVVLTTAETLPELTAADVDVVRTVLDERGLSDCDRIVPMEDEESYLGFSGVGQITGSLGTGVAPLYYRIDVPADATSLKFQMSRLTISGRYDVYFRAGDPPRYQTGRTPPLVADHVEPMLTEVTFTDTSAFPLPRCETLYMAIVTTDLTTRGESVYNFYSDLETSGDPSAECPEPPEPDMGPVGSDGGVAGDGGMEMPDDDDGCGCRVVAPSTHAPGALLPLMALWLYRRRR